jgi:uncharacterized protein YndB with AHSA1/START domain
MRDAVSATAAIGADADRVWRFLTTERDAWWPDMRFEAVVGAPLVETWIEDGQQRTATGEVAQCEPPRVLAFRWSEASWRHPLDVVISLRTEPDVTVVTITETGFATASTPVALPDEHEEGWRYHLEQMKRVSEG